MRRLDSADRSWVEALQFDPVPPLLASTNAAVSLLARRDLLGDSVDAVDAPWQSPDVTHLVQRQLPSGAWRYPNPRRALRSVDQYNLLETYRVLGELVEKHGLDRRHPAIRRASLYVLRHQSADGDIRGIYGTQYSPNYTAGFLELLTKAGLASRPQVQRGYRWLLSVRQNDGGWAIPLRTAGHNFRPATRQARTIQPIRDQPSSHLVTGVVLRALVVHPRYRRAPAAHTAGAPLVSRVFKRFFV